MFQGETAITIDDKGRLSDNAPRRSRRDNRVARKRAEESPGSTGHGAR